MLIPNCSLVCLKAKHLSSQQFFFAPVTTKIFGRTIGLDQRRRKNCESHRESYAGSVKNGNLSNHREKIKLMYLKVPAAFKRKKNN